MDTLNKSQLEAVLSTEGCIRVIAGAGSGKTRALSMRFAYLVNELGITPGNILCVTFTNKAANEMKQRIHVLTGDNDTGYVNTFHGFCVSVLKEDSYLIQYPKNFLVLDNADIDSILKMIYEERHLTLRHRTFSQARDMIEIKKIKEEPEYYLDLLRFSLEELEQKYRRASEPDDIIFYGYLYEQKKCFGLDYNDLIKLTLYIFEMDEPTKLKWQQRLEYIMIDEFQDIDELQYDLMKVLYAYHKNLFVVGDPDQTIYTWRGANVKYLIDFDSEFPDVKTIYMMDNYRSTPEILSAANSLISHNEFRIKKNLVSTRKHGAKVLAHHSKTSKEEAKWIVEQIRKLTKDKYEYKDITILYRAHYVSRVIEEEFIHEKLPYTIYSGVPFFGRMEIKDALCYLRMIAYKDDLSFLRIVNTPKRNIGKTRIQFLQTYANENNISLYETLKLHVDHPNFVATGAKSFIDLIERFSQSYQGVSVSKLFSDILDQSGYENMLRTQGSQERLDNLAELKQSIFEYETSIGEETTLEHYLEHCALFSNLDLEDTLDRIKMMTIHTAKGLEFKNVFMCGLNEGIFPSKKTRTKQAMEEERRLAYVAMTRAEDYLFFSEAQGQNFDGSFRYPSRFILEIDPQLLEFTKRPTQELLDQTKVYVQQHQDRLQNKEESQSVQPGQRIKHRVFGSGTIIDIDREQESYLIQFDGMETPRKITFRVKLEFEKRGI